jgi:hypothetical protein
MARKSEKVFPLTQIRKRSGYRRLVFLYFGTLSACGSFPGTRRMEQRTPAIEPGFCTSKELIHSNVRCFCGKTHDCSPSLALRAAQDRVALNSVCGNLITGMLS